MIIQSIVNVIANNLTTIFTIGKIIPITTSF